MNGLILTADNVSAGHDCATAAVVVAYPARDGAAPLPRPAGAMPNVTDRGRIKFGAGFRNASK